MRKSILSALFLLYVGSVSAQDTSKSPFKNWTLSGSVQSDILIPEKDKNIGAEHYSEFALTNTFANLRLSNKYIEAGARFEYTEHPLPGFEPDYGGYGVPHFFIKGNYKNTELTLGDFYDQFGSGLIFRTYEERSLGIDNALRGVRLVVEPFHGMRIKALGGRQRRYWNWNHGIVYGADAELGLHEFIPSLRNNQTMLTLGGSVVRRHQSDGIITTVRPDESGNLSTYNLKLPKNLTAFDGRINLHHKNWDLLGEYAQTTQNPSFDNGYIYRRGRTILLSSGYSKRGFSVLLQAKRSEDMSLRSDRKILGSSSFFNYLPAFSTQHTYALAAHYPYATQYTPGEWAFQGEMGVRFKRNTPLGGRYGTYLKINASHIRGIETRDLEGVDGQYPKGSRGFSSRFFRMGHHTFYQDINVKVEKKLSRVVKVSGMYVNQVYNKSVVEGHGGTIHANIGILEGKFKLDRKKTLRTELQYLHTRQDQKDWWFGLVELSVLPHLMFTISDQYNGHVPEGGKDGPEHKQHYYNGSVTFTHHAHRLQVGYGRNCAGYNCSGGVCRWIPAQKGVQVSYNYSF